MEEKLDAKALKTTSRRSSTTVQKQKKWLRKYKAIKYKLAHETAKE
jgi:hypothetical protein